MMHTKLVLLAAVLIAGTYAIDCTTHPMAIMAKTDPDWLSTSVAAGAADTMPFCKGLATK